jgi:acetyltransferase
MLRSQCVEIAASAIEMRPATPEDQPRIQALVRGLTPRTWYLRFFNGLRELGQAWLERFSRADPRGDFSLLAIARETGSLAGMAQYCADPYPSRADFAVLVADHWQGVGVGRQLVSGLLAVARASGLLRMEGDVLSENRAMLQLLQGAGFRLQRDRESALFQHASLALSRRAPNFSCNTAIAL